MILRLTPEQVATMWPIVRPAVAQALPPVMAINSQGMANLLTSLLEETAQMWVMYEGVLEAERGLPIGILTTAIIQDPVSRTKNLLVYTSTNIGGVSSREHYEDGLDSLRTFAEANDCSQVLAFVDNDALVSMYQRLGGVKVSNLMRF